MDLLIFPWHLAKRLGVIGNGLLLVHVLLFYLPALKLPAGVDYLITTLVLLANFPVLMTIRKRSQAEEISWGRGLILTICCFGLLEVAHPSFVYPGSWSGLRIWGFFFFLLLAMRVLEPKKWSHGIRLWEPLFWVILLDLLVFFLVNKTWGLAGAALTLLGLVVVLFRHRLKFKIKLAPPAQVEQLCSRLPVLALSLLRHPRLDPFLDSLFTYLISAASLYFLVALLNFPGSRAQILSEQAITIYLIAFALGALKNSKASHASP